MAQQLAAGGGSVTDLGLARAQLPRHSPSIAAADVEEDGGGGEGGDDSALSGSLALSTSLQAMMRAKERHDGRLVRPAGPQPAACVTALSLAVPCPAGPARPYECWLTDTHAHGLRRAAMPGI